MSGTEPTGHNPEDGQLPEGWEFVLIGTLSSKGEFFDGDWVESKDQDPSGRIRLTQLADVGEGTFRNRSDRWLRDDQAEQLNVNYLQEGDLLIARMPDPLGRCCAVPNLEYQAVTVVDVAVLRIRNERILNSFVMWILNSPTVRRQMVDLASGTTRQRISRKNLSTIKLPIPPLAEQERIVEILEDQLSRLDAALESVRVVREKAAQFRRSLLHAAFTGTLTGHNPEDGQLPEGWELSTLGSVAKWGSGGTPKSGTAAFYNGSIPWAVIGDLTEGEVFDTAQTITQLGLDSSSAKVVEPGTVLLAMYGASIGRTGIAAVEMATNQAIAFARVDEKKMNRNFLLKYLQEQKRAFIEAGQGGAQPNISQTVIKPWPIPVPPLVEQERIVEILEEHLSRLDASLAVAAAIEKRSAALRRSLLHAAFTGRLTEHWRGSVHV